MGKFELCFPFPESNERYLVPELLDKQEIREVETFEAKECLNFQYHYPVLPEGLLPRFIVRTHILSSDQRRWKTGVILEFEGNRALVRADAQDKKVKVSIDGPGPGRQRLLAVIRSDFDSIHASFSFDPKEMVPVPGRPEVMVRYQKLRTFESSGMLEFPEEKAGEIIKINVQEMLNGVDLGDRRKKLGHEPDSRVVRLFCSYAHKDKTFRDQLETHLKILERLGAIDFWSDRDIDAGDRWKEEIDQSLERADIILLLVSADFMASDYSWEKEMKRALEREKAKEATVIPVIIRKVNWKKAPFAKLQALPAEAQAVALWEDRDSAWTSVAEGIERVAEELRKKDGNGSRKS